jgi:hypothetical protein
MCRFTTFTIYTFSPYTLVGFNHSEAPVHGHEIVKKKVVKALILNSGGTGFESLPEDRVS